MNYAILVTLLFSSVQYTLADDDEDVCCAPRFVDGVKSCPDFESQGLNEKALVIGFQDDAEAGGLIMNGAFDLLMSIEDDYEIEIAVQRLTEIGKEYMYGAAANICGSMKEEDAPWSPLVKSVNITGCPIKEGVYPMSQVILNLDFASSIMKHEFCGEYEIEVAILHALEKVACFILPVEVYEK